MSDWEAIRAAYRESRSLKSVAEHFGIPIGSIKARAHREKWSSGMQAGHTQTHTGMQNHPARHTGTHTGMQDSAPMHTGTHTETHTGMRDLAPVHTGAHTQTHTGMQSDVPRIPDSINSLSKLDAARFYHANLKFAVHALLPPDRGDEGCRGKKPVHKGWRDHTAAEVTSEYLDRHFGPGSKFNLGAVVRPPYVHIDLDSKPDAGASVREWLSNQPHLASVPRERTGGGAHLLFICRDLPKHVASAKKAPVSQVTPAVQAELYTTGMNIALSPSVHKSGHRYEWEVTGPIPEVGWNQLRSWFAFEQTAEPQRGRPQKEKPWWSKWDEDLRTLDLAGVMDELGHLGEIIDADSNKWSVRCPWESDHTGGTNKGPGSDTAIFSHSGMMPAFKCLHAHCSGRGLRDLLEWADKKKPGIVASRCTSLRVWQPGNNGSGGRPQVILPALGRPHSAFGTDLGKLIGPKLDMFRFAEQVVQIRFVGKADQNGAIPGKMLAPIRPAELVTAVERTVETGVVREDKAGDEVFLAKSMSEQDARITLASGFFGECLPRINRLLDVPVPHLSDDGQIIYPKPGFDERFGTWLNPHAPVLRHMEFEDAIRLLLQDLLGLAEHGGFWWHDQQSRVHALARFITPFCRGLMNWRRTPLWIFDGNREGSGKDTCADLAHIAYTGRSITCAPLSKECDDEMRKRITSALMAGSRFFHLANMKGHVRYASLEAATDDSGIWEDRRLGASETITLPNETEFSFSANNATWEPDIERRCRRIRLLFRPEHVNSHKYRHNDIRAWVRMHRADLLSAVNAIVVEWVRRGCPPGPTPFTSFPEWSRVVGGVFLCAGLPDPCQPNADNKVSGDQSTAAMRDFFAIAFERFGNAEILKPEFQDFVQGEQAVHDLFEWIVFTERRGLIVFGKLLTKFDNRELGGITMHVTQTSRNRASYRFEREPESSALIDILPRSPIMRPDNSSQPSKRGCGDVGGCFHHAIISGKKIEKKFENEGNYLSPYIAIGKTSPNIPTSPLAHPTGFPDMAAKIREAGSVALDIETYGSAKNDALNPWRGDIRLLSLKIPNSPPWLIDLQATGYNLGDLGSALEAVEVIAHNAKFDLLWLAVKCRVRPKKIFCTLTAARLLSAGTKPGNNLDQCLERYLGVPPGKDQARSDWGGMFLTDDQLAYAVRDVLHLHDLAAKLNTLLCGEELEAVRDLELDLIPVVVAMEAAGMSVD
ncbi:MAG: bifunctional DNA primase/polymerase, partial [Verrucomicrobia bacterium]|nr:bifunctional DNA primase/polymerase [Verrucomicrobiota bacterium]